MEKPKLPRLNDLGKRLVWSFILLGFSLWVIFSAPAWLFYAYAVMFILLGLHEYITLSSGRNRINNPNIIYFLGAVVPLIRLWDLSAIFIPLVILALFFVNFDKKNMGDAFRSASVGVFGLCWIAWLFSYICDLRYLPNGSWWVYHAIMVTKMGDAGAYFIGKRFGKEKFVEHISPKKTTEGAYAQVITSIIFSVLGTFYLDVPWFHLLTLGLVIGVIAQLGDLVESMVKRSMEVKDSGAIPGLGGILDVLDSVLFTIPLVYFYVLKVVL